jgi:hypothetical protein
MDYERQPDPNLASELRQGAGQEWNEEAAEDERLTELHRRRRLTLADQAKEWVNRGDRVSAEFGGHSFGGLVTKAGEDYATVEGPDQTADIVLETARWSVIASDGQSETSPGGAESFRAALHEHAASDHVVRLTLPDADMIMGRVAVVASDHIEVIDVDERRFVVPMYLVLGVVRSTDHP